MTKHYDYSPSGMSRILACPGSVSLNRGKDSPGNAHTQRGTVGHALAERMLTGTTELEAPSLCNRCNHECVTPPCQHCGSSEYRTDNELFTGVQRYVKYIDELAAMYDFLHEAVEQTIESKLIPDFGGTIDFYAIYRDNVRGGVWGHIVDLKCGTGLRVEAVGNKQLLSYASLVKELHPNVTNWLVTVVQPLLADSTWNGVTEVEVSDDDIEQHRQAVLAAAQSNALHPGDHCRWCLSVADCPAIQREAVEVFEIIPDNPKAVDVDALQPGQIAELLAKEKRVKHFFDAMRDAVLVHMQNGVQFPGLKAVRSIGNRKWGADEEDVLKKLVNRLKGQKIGKKALTETRLKSPAQLEKEGHGEAIADLVVRSDLGYRVVLESDRGEPVIFTAPEDLFDVVETGDDSDFSDLLD